MSELRCGEWPSPVSAADVARAAAGVGGGVFVDGQPWWAESRPDEGGRTAICRLGADGAVVDVLPQPWNARTRVHEYGGGAWTVVGTTLVFANFTDQRLYAVDVAGSPRALTAAPAQPAADRYGDLVAGADGASVLCVRERHLAGHDLERDIVAVPLDGSAVDDPAAVRRLVGGSRFAAFPRISPSGRRIAWIAWEHPQMPWDGTELRVAETEGGQFGAPRVLMGSTTESVLQPEWLDDDTLVVVSDRSGWWNPYRLAVDDAAEPEPLHGAERDFGGPLWALGMRWVAPLPDDRLLMTGTVGIDSLVVVDRRTGEARDVTPPGWESIVLGAVDGDRVLVVAGGSTVPTGLRLLDLGTSATSDVRVAEETLPPAAYRSAARRCVFQGPGGRDVHAFVYPPHHPDYSPAPGELPPYLVLVHGGPTSHAVPRVSAAMTFWTSRGIGVVDVNYGGSSGYGRAYRERLRGQWGVVDVEDVVAVANGLATSGAGDGHRVAIQGGSAGGWTVLAALTTSDAFACGISLYGVADAALLARHTHDFEARYLDGLIGALPDAQATYDARSPLGNVERLSCPVLLLQGLDDPVVPPAQAEVFRDAMARKGISHAYLAFEGESHGFRRTETVTRVCEASLSFLGQVMGFDPPGVPRLALDGG